MYDGIESADSATMENSLPNLTESWKSSMSSSIYKSLLSISRGYSLYDSTEDSEYIDTFRKSDNAMYMDKAEYHKQHDRRWI